MIKKQYERIKIVDFEYVRILLLIIYDEDDFISENGLLPMDYSSAYKYSQCINNEGFALRLI